jgi:cytochrome c553
MMSRPIIIPLLLLVSIGLKVVEAGGELPTGKIKAESACQTCHGIDGIGTMAGVPNLSGQKKEYMVTQLKAFQSGRREHNQMSIIAQMLTDDDIDNVSEWYSSIKITVETPQ